MVGEPTSGLIERFMTGGRLRRLPSKAAKGGEVLRHLANLFEPGERYAERQVDAVLLEVSEGGETDHVTLRRYLVDYGLLDREAGEYWRRGGWVTGT